MAEVNWTNLRTGAHVELKEANRAWNDCVIKNFFPQWLKGESVSIEDVCVEERARLDEADGAVYAERPIQAKMFTLPTVPQQ